ncbi:rabenosyn-5-like isoform X2 [Argiope bruennichi]|uniref:Rabenosyn-5 like protein n=2 Tax=Argiope bruennichi TaxID=94029 RepID=A0A8T0EXV1_ARGBR|nr:rabenosyn-5-like isoform X2 [Argiope bruennichi]KAF8783196.1 Rabenosyn-5 like protein [Argiope bruennichi]
MAKSSSGFTEGEIREGLLCPICMYDLHTIDQLQEHFDVNHSTEDTDVIQALKGFFDKAKRKILKQDTLDSDFIKPPFEIEPVYTVKSDFVDISWEQDLGLISSHTQYFKMLRDKKINRYVIETNKLLIRLDKLICDISSDPEKKKEYEKSIVPWVADSDVPLCPGCAKSFGLSRRWHHCRLCGYVMCNSCSFFISYDFARKLTLPAISDDQRLLQKSSPVSRKGSAASLMSVVNIGSDHQNLRICKDCNMLLQRHDKMLELKNHRPVIVQLYERLRECMSEVDKLVPHYKEMIESLNSGETDYQLQDVQELKFKITKLAEKIDTHSKRIAKLESTDEESNSRALQLQSGIRMAASQFLRNNVLTLPSPPTEEELARYRSMRLDQVHRRIQQEKEAEMLRNQKESSKSPSPVKSPNQQRVAEPVSPDTGWCVSTDSVKEEEDPMVQQIKIIHKYIKQAKLDHKYDEVKMLENNLKELQLEHSKQKTSY